MGLIFNSQERETCRTVSVFEVSTKTRPLSEARRPKMSILSDIVCTPSADVLPFTPSGGCT